VEWYKTCLELGLLEFDFNEGRVAGFIEFVRLNETPDRIDGIRADPDTVKTAPILFIGNCVMDGGSKRIFWRLLKRNNNIKAVVWHNKKRDRFFMRRFNAAS